MGACPSGGRGERSERDEIFDARDPSFDLKKVDRLVDVGDSRERDRLSLVVKAAGFGGFLEASDDAVRVGRRFECLRPPLAGLGLGEASESFAHGFELEYGVSAIVHRPRAREVPI